ncbi:hypothetical protein M3221_02070 [Domibacillus indicus]|uniref:hypothetical protein n=1 Tax=Domibacillus indicus TaxID=1437523 RepID=UPI00203FB262|nr:hypothetical protein [Domibacillus indicus]MCM3787201.1 hypothetical protein [Domibacillus indicus]
MKKWTYILAAGFLLAGCSQGEGLKQKKQAGEEVITVKASELFKGGEKALQPHLHIQGDAVILNKPSDVAITFDIWQNGKIAQKGSRLSNDPQGDIKEVSFSLQPDLSNKNSQLVTIACNGNELSLSSSVDVPSDTSISWAADLAENAGDEGLKIKPDERKAVWGYGMNKVNGAASSTTEESIQQADWGMLIYIEAAR